MQNRSKSAVHSASCACGAVEVAFDCEPFIVISCGCDDCQAAAHALEALPGAPEITEPVGATPLAAFPRASMRVVQGANMIEPYRLNDSTPTKRMVATCCNSALYIDFDRGPFWVSVYRDRLTTPPPMPRWRVQTKYLATELPNDIPNHRKWPAAMIGHTLLTGLQTLVTRRK